MKKINYEIVGRFEYGSKYGVISKKTVEGQQIDEYAAVRKNDWKTCPWTVDSWQTGIAITTTGSATRKAAIEAYEQMKERVAYILDDPKKMETMLKQKEEAIPETTLATYEELDITTINDHRLDKLTITAKNNGCIVKTVKEETYQCGGHIKVYGTAEMLQGVNELMKKWSDEEMKQNEQNEQNETPQAETTTTQEPEQIDVSTLNADNLKDYLPALLMSLANDKHNSSIILAAGIEAGAIKPEALLEYFQTGRMPAVHTFDVWQKAGYQIRKGETAAFTARIWKHVEKTVKLSAEDAAAMNTGNMIEGIEYHEGDEIQRGNFIKKNAYFFTADQVTKNADLPDLPEDVKKESRGGCCWISGNTYAIKDALKAAGFRWSKKNNAWYRREAA